MSTKQKIYIPTYISSVDYQPARVQPRILFYNGVKQTEDYYLRSASIAIEKDGFPYFDNYSGQNTTTQSLSLLFNNEVAPYGEIPTASLYSEYWENYISLLYNPRTRLVNASAIIPLADYFKMELNDIAEFRGNYYHIRAINDYNLTTGECNIQLLGPILQSALNTEELINLNCEFNYTSSLVTTTTTSTTTTSTTTTTTTQPPAAYNYQWTITQGQCFPTPQSCQQILPQNATIQYYNSSGVLTNQSIGGPFGQFTGQFCARLIPVPPIVLGGPATITPLGTLC